MLRMADLIVDRRRGRLALEIPPYIWILIGAESAQIC